MDAAQEGRHDHQTIKPITYEEFLCSVARKVLDIVDELVASVVPGVRIAL